MRFTNIIEDILGNRSKIKVLRYLISSNLGLTGRQLSRVTGMHHRTGHNVLKELSALGIIMMQQTGKAIVYKINNNNLLVEEVLKPIFAVEKNLLPRAIAAILKGAHIHIVSAIVFGSVASSSERGTSDIDVLFLVASNEEQKKLTRWLEKIEYSFLLRYGNMLSPVVLTLNEFCKRLRRKDNLIQNIVQKGKAVYGKTIQEVLVECQRKK